jgi:ABC-type bacteriocin/lantibiotic exporter with double-glycine peptidase domain
VKVFVKRVYVIIKQHLFAEVTGLFFTILATAAVFGSPIVSRYVIDDVLPTHSYNKLYFGLIAFFIVCASQPVFSFIRGIVFLNITEKVTVEIRQRMFANVVSAPLKFFDNNKKGEILSRIINDGRSASQFITDFFVIFVKNIVLILMIIIGMLYLSFYLTGIVLGLFVIFFVVNWLLGKKFDKLSQTVQENYDRNCVAIEQMTDSILTIKSFTAENEVNNQYRKILNKAYKDNKKIATLNVVLNTLTEVVIVFSLTVIYGLGSLEIMNGRMTLGTVVAMSLYFQILEQPVYELLNNNIQFQTAIPIFKRIYEYFEMALEDTSCVAKPLLFGEIKVDKLSFHYEDEKNWPLRNINLKMPAKGFIALVGRSGAGKSTFVKLLLKLYEPSSGAIYIGDQNLKDLKTNTVRESISFVSQDTDIFNASIKDNIRCGKIEATDEEIISVCSTLKLHKKIMSLSDGYETIISERVNLSGGEKQRIAIARALVKKTTIFILDEPTSSLDPENESIISDTLKELSKERLVIVIAHRMTTILNADHIFVFDGGQVTKSEKHNILRQLNSINGKLVQKSEMPKNRIKDL